MKEEEFQWRHFYFVQACNDLKDTLDNFYFERDTTSVKAPAKSEKTVTRMENTLMKGDSQQRKTNGEKIAVSNFKLKHF